MNVAPLTYKALCEDPDYNPFAPLQPTERIRQIYAPWATSDPAANLVLTKEQLRDESRLDLSARMTGGIGVFVEHPTKEGGTLEVIHSVYAHAINGAHRGKLFVYLNDLQGIDATILELNEDLFDFTADVNLATDVDYQLELFAANENLHLVPAWADGVARTSARKTRKSMYIPSPLLPYVMGQSLSPKEALHILHPVIISLDLVTECAPLLTFLIAATTKTADGNKPVTVQASPGTAPANLLDVMQDRRENLLYRHLPSLRPAAGRPSDPALVGMMTTMVEMKAAAVDNLDDLRLARELAHAPKTVTDKWPNHVDRLLKLCNCETPEDLPPYWHEAANFKKGAGITLRSVLQDSVQLAAHELIVAFPHVTVQHATGLQNWEFSSGIEWDLASGLAPFTITPPGSLSLEATARREEEYEQSANHTTMMEACARLSYTDARSIRGREGYAPVNFDEAESMLESFGALLGAVIGVKHPNVTAHFGALRLYRLRRQALKAALIREFGERLAACKFVLYFHIHHRNWFSEQWQLNTTDTLPPPDLERGFREFAGGMLYWIPESSGYPLFNRLQGDAGQRNDAGRNNARGGGGGGAGNNGGNPNQPPTSGGQASNSTEREERPRDRNKNRDSRLIGNSALAQRIRDIKVKVALDRTSQKPVTIQGEPRCLSFHLKGSCFMNCPRKADHKALEGADKELLFDWCKLAYP